MSEEKEIVVDLELLDKYRFNVSFAAAEADLLMDEPEPLGDGTGPNATAVLSAAIGNCLSASLLFCLRKARLDPNDVKTKVRTRTARNEKGRLRVGSTQVEITLDTDEAKEKLSRCLGLFEDFCIVTQSVRQGIPVDVTVVTPEGMELHGETAAG